MTSEKSDSRSTERLSRRCDKSTQRRSKEAIQLEARRRLHADVETVLRREA